MPAPVVLAALHRALADWTARLQAAVAASGRASAENAGHREECIGQHMRELARVALQEAVQAKADATPCAARSAASR